MSSAMEETLAQGVKDEKLPNAVVYATNKDGSFNYSCAVGSSHYGQDKPIKEDAVFQLASSSKLITSIAAMQVVEKGLIALDDDVTPILHELKDQPILVLGEAGKKPTSKKRENPITLRHLLTHTSGICYAEFHPTMLALKADPNNPFTLDTSGKTVPTKSTMPLLFEPGTSWAYGASTDWAGKLVERLTSTTLEDHVRTHINGPLNLTTLTYWPARDPALHARVPVLTRRGDDDWTREGALRTTGPRFDGMDDCFGGAGMYGSTGDYLAVLRSLLANDGKLLTPASVEQMFTPQLSASSRAALNAGLAKGPMSAFITCEINPEVELDYGLGGVLFMRDDVGRRRKGTMAWSGMANTFWEVDREAGVALAFSTNTLPAGDEGVEEMVSVVEREVYALAGVEESKL